MPIFHLFTGDVVRDGMTLFDVVSEVVKVTYLGVSDGGMGFLTVQDCA